MSVAVRGRVPGKWDDNTARHITERLQALERAISGGTPVYTAPGVPTFGTGTLPGGGGGSGGSGGGATSDHGALSGLGDDDHPQYAQKVEPAVPRAHVHGPDDVLLLDQRFYRRGETAQPAPHAHRTDDVIGLDFGKMETVKAHAHVVGDVADLRPDDSQFVLSGKIFGG